MADDDWVADVRRWCLSGALLDDHPESADIGYEAAHPALQARHWPDASAARLEPYQGSMP